MISKIKLEDVQRIQSEYDHITDSIRKVCDIIKQFSYRKQLPRILTSTLWIFKHGIVYPDYGWTLLPRVGTEEARIRVPAWDGYDEEMSDNSTVLIPFDFINMEKDALVELLKGEKTLESPPLRNCDVGTPDEQTQRFEDFCLKHIGCAEEMGGRHCVGCPLEKASMNIIQKCELYWAQMPYEKETDNEQN